MNDTLLQALLESWTRQCQILTNIASLINGGNANAKPAPEGWTIAFHLCHIHAVRYEWLSKVSPEQSRGVGHTFYKEGGEWHAITDLDEIRRLLALSERAIYDAVKDKLEQGVTEVGPYTNPVMFLQHMVWHEGYHFGLIVLALRNAGEEPSEQWDEDNVWSIWRGPEEPWQE